MKKFVFLFIHCFNKVINIGDCAYTFFVLNTDNLNDGVRFAIQYIDSMTNEYIQY